MDYLINTTTDSIHSTGGIALIGKIFERIGFGASTSGLPHPEILRVFGGLLVQGRSRYEEVDLFRHDQLFRDSLNLSYVPARETHRLYLERIAAEPERVQNEVDTAVVTLLNRSTLTPVQAGFHAYLPIDVDTSCKRLRGRS